tara:strand:- start:10 stop:690 length:681 start_codon:yes stop_codon:yes gene_type:complete
MKIYFDGCSWTEGAELENQEEERFSKVLCNELGAEEYNFAVCGGSNYRIVRNLLVQNNIEDYDLAVIQMTFPTRTEYYDHQWTKGTRNRPWDQQPDNLLLAGPSGDANWVKVSPKTNYNKWLHGENGDIRRLGEKFTNHSDFWKYWYMHVSHEKYFETQETIHYHTIRNSCKIPLILVSINKWTNLPFDMQLEDGTRNMRHKKGHPNKDLHRIFADKMIDIINHRL